MTPQEALNRLDEIVIGDLELKVFLSKALKKQIPKKPVIDKAYSHGRYEVAFCPNCKKLLGFLSMAKDIKHCEPCGQALDWSDTE